MHTVNIIAYQYSNNFDNLASNFIGTLPSSLQQFGAYPNTSCGLVFSSYAFFNRFTCQKSQSLVILTKLRLLLRCKCYKESFFLSKKNQISKSTNYLLCYSKYSVRPLERSISVPIYFGVPFRVTTNI